MCIFYQKREGSLMGLTQEQPTKATGGHEHKQGKSEVPYFPSCHTIKDQV